jgi:hypothetical protein
MLCYAAQGAHDRLEASLRMLVLGVLQAEHGIA